jgi:hypothetical protein
MVVEHFRKGARLVYERARERGRMLPTGLVYIDSWIDANTLDRCFQLMETDDPALFDEWFSHWSDLGELEVVPVIDSQEASQRVLG